MIGSRPEQRQVVLPASDAPIRTFESHSKTYVAADGLVVGGVKVADSLKGPVPDSWARVSTDYLAAAAVENAVRSLSLSDPAVIYAHKHVPFLAVYRIIFNLGRQGVDKAYLATASPVTNKQAAWMVSTKAMESPTSRHPWSIVFSPAGVDLLYVGETVVRGCRAYGDGPTMHSIADAAELTRCIESLRDSSAYEERKRMVGVSDGAAVVVPMPSSPYRFVVDVLEALADAGIGEVFFMMGGEIRRNDGEAP